tara:strand:+ start:426 stop:632 length:207 start_codon:yes stop_codon:yes gene_type:complete
MKIESAKYQGITKWDSAKSQMVYDNSVNDNIIATIDGEKMFVPIDDANRHYQAILRWVAEGNTIEEAG